MEFKIRVEKDCAWCDVNGTFIYGKDEVEVRNVLNNLIRMQ